MDRQIATSEVNKSRYKSYFKYFLIAIVLALAFWLIRGLLKQNTSAENLHIVSVERGDMLNTLTAAGTVVPSSEREINAPVTTEVKNVLKSAGDIVNINDLILELDDEYTRLSFDQLSDELELKRNNIDKLKLEYDKNLRDLDYQNKIKALQLDQLKAQVTDQKRLNQVGGATDEEVESAQLKLKVADLEKKMIENELAYRQSVNVNEKRGLELQYTIQEKRLAELKRKLRETSVRAPVAGVITWVNEDIGKKVSEGETLVKLANLNNYRVEASSSDRNSNRIDIGMPVQVRILNTNLEGQITTILPSVENNTIKFHITLKDPNVDLLRPNMRAEVSIITDKKDDVLRVKNGTVFKGASTQYVYVVNGNRAIKKRIKKGLTNGDFVEITDGLSEGDRIIISSMEDYDHLDAFDITPKK